MKIYTESFDNIELPDVELSLDEIKEIKDNVIKESILMAVAKLKKYNKRININISEEEIFSMYNDGEERSSIKAGGLSHFYLMKDVLLRAIDREVEKEGKIRRRVMVWNPKQMIIPSPQWLGNKLYTVLYLIDNKVIKYSISTSLEVIEIEKCPLEKIRYAGVKKEGKKELWSIGLDYKEFNWYIKDDKISEELGSFISELNKLGIKDKEDKKIFDKIISIIFAIIAILAFSAMIIKVINLI